jgi:hypothetical protein
VLVSGDEEYRSEEALPQLARILSEHHGFKCTVLFAIDPADGTVNPNINNNIPGLEALASAAAMILFTRFRDLPDDQMKYIADYVNAGKPIIAMRTATHAFAPTKNTFWRPARREVRCCEELATARSGFPAMSTRSGRIRNATF